MFFFFRKFNINQTWLLFFLKNLVEVEFQFWPCLLWALRSKDRVNNHVEESMNHNIHPFFFSPQCIDICMGRIAFVNNCYKNEQEGIIYSLFSFWLANMRNVDYFLWKMNAYKPLKKIKNIVQGYFFLNFFV